jgi:hypothetical protein
LKKLLQHWQVATLIFTGIEFIVETHKSVKKSATRLLANYFILQWRSFDWVWRNRKICKGNVTTLPDNRQEAMATTIVNLFI